MKKRHIIRQEYEAACAVLHQKDADRYERFWAEIRSVPNAAAAHAAIVAFITGAHDSMKGAS